MQTIEAGSEWLDTAIELSGNFFADFLEQVQVLCGIEILFSLAAILRIKKLVHVH